MTLGIEAIVTLLTGVGGLIVWSIRQEGRINQIEKNSEKIEKEQTDQRTKIAFLENKISDKLSAIEKMVANIEGRLSVHSK